MAPRKTTSIVSIALLIAVILVIVILIRSCHTPDEAPLDEVPSEQVLYTSVPPSPGAYI